MRATVAGVRGVCAILALTCGAQALADDAPRKKRRGDRNGEQRDGGRGAREEREENGGRSSVFAPAREPNRPRSDIGMPILTFFLPGLDQWWEGQTTAAGLYTGVALGGYIYAGTVAEANGINLDGTPKEREDEDKADGAAEGDENEKEGTALDSKDVAGRKVQLGGLVAQGAGGMSAYHSFRTAVRTRRAHDQYDFLKHEETPLEVLGAPFQFHYLARPRTFIPLAIGAGLAYLQLTMEPPEDIERTSFTSADGFFTGAYSFNAGTHEEAMFRGWIMPVMREYWDSDFLSNAAQSLIFGLAHYGPGNRAPIVQTVLGYHLGYVTQEDEWQIGEAVFIHVWWDVLAFATIYHYREKQPEEKQAAIKPVLWLPPLSWTF